jgi:hypothetical protein
LTDAAGFASWTIVSTGPGVIVDVVDGVPDAVAAADAAAPAL